mmetsp:Transcript_14270/g.53716  ORF Transcript_14270/g.53716 Transcript_14270/m.53716 type:complete len:468 (+) Transcript_14270:1276-2679(+)
MAALAPGSEADSGAEHQADSASQKQKAVPDLLGEAGGADDLVVEYDRIHQGQRTGTEGSNHAYKVIEGAPAAGSEAKAAEHNRCPDKVLDHLLCAGLGSLPQAELHETAVHDIYCGEQLQRIGQEHCRGVRQLRNGSRGRKIVCNRLDHEPLNATPVREIPQRSEGAENCGQPGHADDEKRLESLRFRHHIADREHETDALEADYHGASEQEDAIWVDEPDVFVHSLDRDLLQRKAHHRDEPDDDTHVCEQHRFAERLDLPDPAQRDVQQQLEQHEVEAAHPHSEDCFQHHGHVIRHKDEVGRAVGKLGREETQIHGALTPASHGSFSDASEAPNSRDVPACDQKHHVVRRHRRYDRQHRATVGIPADAKSLGHVEQKGAHHALEKGDGHARRTCRASPGATHTVSVFVVYRRALPSHGFRAKLCTVREAQVCGVLASGSVTRQKPRIACASHVLQSNVVLPHSHEA